MSIIKGQISGVRYQVLSDNMSSIRCQGSGVKYIHIRVR